MVFPELRIRRSTLQTHMISAKDLAAKLETLQQEADAKVAAIAEYVTVVNTVITACSFTEPNAEGNVYCRLTVKSKLPAITKNGDYIKTNSILLFKNQIISAMAESPKLAIYAKFSYLKEEENGIQRLSRLLAGQPIQLKYIGLEAGDTYVDAVTGNVSTKVVASNVFRYSISSIGEVIEDKDDSDSNKNS